MLWIATIHHIRISGIYSPIFFSSLLLSVTLALKRFTQTDGTNFIGVLCRCAVGVWLYILYNTKKILSIKYHTE